MEKKQVRSLVTFALKFGVAAVLIGWLVHRGTLDFKALGILFDQPLLLVANVAVFVFAVVMVTMRWRVLLRLAGVTLPFWRAFPLQLTAQFFNVVIPGAVGGDVVKALYVARDAEPKARTTILLIVFVERLLGLAGLVVLCLLITIAQGATVFDDAALRPLALGVVALGVGAIGGPIVLIILMRYAGERIETWTSGPSSISRLLNKGVSAVRLLTASPRSLAAALGYSMASWTGGLLYFSVLTRAIAHAPIPFSKIATVFPLGVITVVVPISPSGMGVGHVAFDKLFALVGVAGGATFFNVYVLGQLVPNLCGVFPYLSLKRSGDLPTAKEA